MATLLKLYYRLLRDWPHLFAVWASVELINKFHGTPVVDYTTFTGFTSSVGIMIGVLTGKHYVDTKADKLHVNKSQDGGTENV